MFRAAPAPASPHLHYLPAPAFSVFCKHPSTKSKICFNHFSNVFDPRRAPQSSEHNPVPSTSDDDEENEEKARGIKMEVSASVLRRLQGESLLNGKEDGLGLIERNRLKRAAKFRAKKRKRRSSRSGEIAKSKRSPRLRYSNCDELLESIKPGFPRLQQPGKLDVDRILSLSKNYLNLEFVIPRQEISFGFDKEKPIDETLIKGCMASVFLSATMRAAGGLKFEKEKDWYSEKLVVYIVYKHLAEKMQSEMNRGNESKAEELAAILGKLEPFVSTVISPELLVLYAFENSGFVPDGRIGKLKDGFVFPGRVDTEPKKACDQIQQYLDFTGQDNVVFLLKSRNEESFCLVAPWSWLLVSILPDDFYGLVSACSLLLAFAGLLQFGHADPGITPFVWQSLIVPGMFISIVLAGWTSRWLVALNYKVSHLLRRPLVLPFPGLGGIGGITSFKGCLPNRKCLLDLSFASSLSSLALSCVACLLGYSVGLDYAFTKDSVNFYGFFLVPSDMFSFSEAFTVLLRKLSVAKFVDEAGGLQFVVSPFALSGLVGLTFTCFSLLPVRRFDGARILTAVLGRENQNTFALILQVLLTPCFLFKNPALGFTWLGYVGLLERYDDLFQREEVSDPSLVRKALGLSLLALAIASFIPAFGE
eukprot:TRINITY_DN28897_c0_g1_i1.p1 TRINITY_DN28897_c0_g1~~TRINITY_DN28897_c0_g1_i1.p1  ORF type:complete len:648 (+),score=85.09 TRINITY_DN28897_c0_g1_i1:70-2013(+)